MISFEGYTETDAFPLIRELLNRVHGFNLTVAHGKDTGIDLWQGFDSKESQTVMCEIKGGLINNYKLLNEITALGTYVLNANPDVFIFVVLSELDIPIKNQILRYFDQVKLKKVILYELKDLDMLIRKFPDLMERFSLEPKVNSINVSKIFIDYYKLIQFGKDKDIILLNDVEHLLSDPFNFPKSSTDAAVKLNEGADADEDFFFQYDL